MVFVRDFRLQMDAYAIRKGECDVFEGVSRAILIALTSLKSFANHRVIDLVRMRVKSHAVDGDFGIGDIDARDRFRGRRIIGVIREEIRNMNFGHSVPFYHITGIQILFGPKPAWNIGMFS